MTSLARHRRDKDRWLSSAPDSPIADRAAFTGLNYYDEDQALRFRVTPQSADGREVTIQTSDGRERIYTRDLEATVEIEGRQVTLTLYGTPHGLFLPFQDATSGNETYGGGRYLDVSGPGRDGTVTIDFNLAYSPFCAYDDRYSCPIPPVENRIDVPVRAGEKAYRRD
jgi:uncharacterized protein (DUF1684 family)